MENRTFFEKRFIKSLVTKYWEEGYEVTEAPQPEQLPDFLSRLPSRPAVVQAGPVGCCAGKRQGRIGR